MRNNRFPAAEAEGRFHFTPSSTTTPRIVGGKWWGWGERSAVLIKITDKRLLVLFLLGFHCDCCLIFFIVQTTPTWYRVLYYESIGREAWWRLRSCQKLFSYLSQSNRLNFVSFQFQLCFQLGASFQLRLKKLWCEITTSYACHYDVNGLNFCLNLKILFELELKGRDTLKEI